MNRRFFYIAVTLLCIFVSSCSKKQSETGVDPDMVEARNSQLSQALTSGNMNEVSVLADSMSLFVDDLTPYQTVQVLTAFYSIHKDAEAKKETRRDLETMRKYVDVYDIAISINPNDLRDAFRKARSKGSDIDYEAVVTEFRERLADYDSSQSSTEEPEEKSDTTKVSSDSIPSVKVEEIPFEHRPAE